MKTFALATISFVVLCGTSTIERQKVERIAEFESAVVSITRYFKPEEITDPKRVGNQGTAWFFETRSHLITIEHVVSNPPLSKDEWTEVWIAEQKSEDPDDVRTERCEVKLLQIIPSPKGEGLALLELRNAFKWGKILQLEREPEKEGEEVFSLGYSNGNLTYASGISHGIGKEGDVPETREGIPLYELSDNINRLSFNSGASGAPVFNTKGKVIGVVSILIGQENSFLGQDFKTGTAWGKPTHMATSTKILIDFKFPD